MTLMFIKEFDVAKKKSLSVSKSLVAKKSLKAFTLVELLFVLAILSILLAMAVPSYQSFVQRSQRTEGQALLLTIQAQLERYYFHHLEYPDSLAKLKQYQANEVSSENSYYGVKLDNEGDCSSTSCYLLVAKHHSGQEKETLSLYSSGEKQGPWR